jgi:hypothetical protein
MKLHLVALYGSDQDFHAGEGGFRFQLCLRLWGGLGPLPCRLDLAADPEIDDCLLGREREVFGHLKMNYRG